MAVFLCISHVTASRVLTDIAIGTRGHVYPGCYDSHVIMISMKIDSSLRIQTLDSFALRQFPVHSLESACSVRAMGTAKLVHQGCQSHFALRQFPMQECHSSKSACAWGHGNSKICTARLLITSTWKLILCKDTDIYLPVLLYWVFFLCRRDPTARVPPVSAMGTPGLVHPGLQLHPLCYPTPAETGRAGALFHCTLSTDPGREKAAIQETPGQPEQPQQAEKVGRFKLKTHKMFKEHRLFWQNTTCITLLSF